MSTLTEIAALLIEDELGKIEAVPGNSGLYVVPHAGKAPEHMTGEQLTFTLQGNMDIARTLYGDDELVEFEKHLKTAYPEIVKDSFNSTAEAEPVKLVRVLKSIAEKAV